MNTRSSREASPTKGSRSLLDVPNLTGANAEFTSATTIQVNNPTEEEEELTNSQKELADLTKKALEIQSSRHTILPKKLLSAHKATESAYEEGSAIPAARVGSKLLLEFKISPYHEENELPNFYNATSALHYFRVLRDLMFNWTRAKMHEKTLRESLISDQVPPGLRIKKNLEVIDCSPQLRLKALQILGNAETQLVKAILTHYEQLIPKSEDNFCEIYEGMTGVTEDEVRLINLKLLAYKNTLMRQQRTRDERRFNRQNNPNTENNNPQDEQQPQAPPEPQPGTSQQTPNANTFPWDQRGQRPPRGRGRGARGQGTRRNQGPRENRLQI